MEFGGNGIVMKGLLLGIDLGTTALKVAALNARTGKPVACASVRLPVRTDSTGAREQDPAALRRVLAAAFRDLRRQTGGAWRGVRGVGVAAQGGSTMIVDRASGKPHTALILWNDRRALAQYNRLCLAKPADYWRRFSWRNCPGWGLARILWLRERRSSLLSADNIYVGAGEYLYFNLTGAWRQDACHALQTGCYNVPERRLDAAPLRLVGAPLDFVAPMRDGHATHPLSPAGAHLTGLPEGIPVAGPYMDHEAGYLSAQGVSDRPLQCSLGTAWVGNFRLPKDARWSSPTQLVIPSVCDDGWLVVQPLMTGNVSWDWALSNTMGLNRERALAELPGIFGERLLPPHGLVALPWMHMPNPLDPALIGAGGFLGLSPATTREDMLRALAAGMAYEMARVFDGVKARVDSVVLGGGASKGAFFRSLLAALFHPLPVHVVADQDLTGARGVLHAFGGPASRGATGRVALPGKSTRKAIADGYGVYGEAARRFYGDLPEYGAVSFENRRKRP